MTSTTVRTQNNPRMNHVVIPSFYVHDECIPTVADYDNQPTYGFPNNLLIDEHPPTCLVRLSSSSYRYIVHVPLHVKRDTIMMMAAAVASKREIAKHKRGTIL
mmetsp:Transcript_55178/g.59784  ORF Transcript_55178/g.59784 Transcript_55178/m.59784 type:complete len:103 (+) Transcript_55178:670-978(+)